MKWICKVCGFIFEGDEPPEICPVCKVGKEFFELLEQGRTWADTHGVGLARGTDPKVVKQLRDRFQNDCREVGLCFAMARAADREGYPEAASLLTRIAMEEAEHAGRLAELLGESLSPGTKSNLSLRVEAEAQESRDKRDLAETARGMGYDAMHDALHEMAKDEARHGMALEGLLRRLFPEETKKK